jgi:hypothetical protein
VFKKLRTYSKNNKRGGEEIKGIIESRQKREGESGKREEVRQK